MARSSTKVILRRAMIWRQASGVIGWALLLFAFLVGPGFAGSQNIMPLPVPKVTLFPGDRIERRLIENRPFPKSTVQRFSVIANPQDLIGKEVRRTLLPGQPVATSSVATPQLVRRGEPARLVFKEQGLVIVAHVEPLENGGAGDVIRVRNIDSGIIISGRIDENGAIQVGD